MEKKRVQIVNFNCTFGETGDPLLSHFTDYFYPAITNFEERHYRNSTYYLNDISLIKVEERLILTGILIEIREQVNETLYDPITKEISPDSTVMELQPISYFGIFLDNHKMYYVKNQKESPSIEKFKTTISYALRMYRKYYNNEMEDFELNINAIPSTEDTDYDKIFNDTKEILYLKFKLFIKNRNEISGSFFDNILKEKTQMSSNDPTLIYPKPHNFKEVGNLIGKSSGFAETELKIVNNNGDKVKYTNEDFQEQTQVDVPTKKSYKEKSRTISKKLSKNETLSATSKYADKEYKRYLPKLLRHFKDIIIKQ